MSCCTQRVSRWNNCPTWRSPFSADELLAHFGKGLIVPHGGWTRATFAADGRRLMMAIHRMARLAQRKAIPFVASNVKALLNGQVEKVISRATSRRGFKSPELLNQNEALWMQAIEEVMRETAPNVILEIVPPLQSVMTQGYSKVSVALGKKQDAETANRIGQQARDIASKITGINETTRQQIERAVRNSVESGATVVETAEELRKHMEGINHARSMTIARTELNRAFTIGSAEAYKDSPTLTHVSVIGCEAEEPTSPQYHGRSTCNYPDLPKHEIDAFLEVGFHINHSGSICPTAFL